MFLSVDKFYFGFLPAIVFSETKLIYVYEILGGRLKGVRTIENPLIRTTKGWSRPLYTERWPGNRGFNLQYFTGDFDIWPLNWGWSLDRWPLHRGWTVNSPYQ